MNNVPNEIPAVFLDSTLDLDELEREIRAALKRAWVMLGLLLATSLGTAAYVLAQQPYR